MARPLRDFALEVFFSRWEFAVAYNIGGSDSQNLTIQELLDLGSDDDRGRFFGHGLGYTETYGAPTLRARIAATYETVSPDDILCFAGAEEAIYVAMTVLLGEGDHAVVLTPNYQSVETLPLSRCDVTGVPLEFGDRWDLDLEKLRAAV
ncbi:MAG: aminotransferase class I/II-fold pyridoxal phosphate-dependent enzyme, partial [Caulobacteraceae bacterium]